jgi:hypothetical protein
MPVYTDPAGGAALDTIQTINSAVSTNASAWGSTISTTFTTPGQTLILPTIGAADVGKSITVQNAGTNAFLLSIATGSITSAIGLTIAAGSTFIVKALSTSNALVASTNAAQTATAESGSVVLSNQIFATNIFANSTNGTFAIPSAGTWQLRYDISTDGTGANTNSQVQIVNSLSVLEPGSERTRGGSIVTAQILTAQVLVTTTGPANYTIQCRNGGSGSITVLNTPNNTSTISWQKISGFAPSSPTPGLTKPLTYGAALNARQPVFLQSDGKVYPMVGSGGALAGGALTAQYFAAGVEGYSVAPIPSTANRFATAVVYSDGTCYHFWADVNPTTGTITQTQNTNITGLTAATVVEGQFLAFNNITTKAVLAYQNGSGLGVAHFSAGVNGLSALLGSVNVAGGVSVSPVVLPTSSPTKFLVSYRGATSELRLIDVAAATPVVTALTNFPINGSSVKSCFIVPLGVVDTYAFVNTSTTTLLVQPFSFNTTTNLVTLIGAGFSLAGFVGALNFDVIYSDSIETWLAIQRDGAPTNILMVRIVQATGAVTFFGPVPFTADAIGNPLAVQIYGHRKVAGSSKFMVAWNTTGAPNQVKYGEWTLDRATGGIAVSLAPVLGVTLPTTWLQNRTFGSNTTGAGYAYHIFGLSTGLQSATFGTYQSAASPGNYMGINQTAGAINTSGVIDLIGSVQAGYTGLTPGLTYYADLATGGVTTASTSGILVGRALSSTELQLSRN